MMVAVDPIYRPLAIPDPPELSDGQVLLRSWTYCDLPCIEEASRDPVIPVGTTVPRPFSKENGTRSFPSARPCRAHSPRRPVSPSWRGSGNAQLLARGSVLR